MNGERPSHVRYLVLGWFCLLAMLAYLHRNAINVPASRIAAELELSPTQLGLVFSMFFWGYTAMQVPSGLLGWRFGTRLVVPVLILIWAGANSLMALALGFWFLVSCRFVMGVAQAGLFPCAVQSFAKWFPPSQRAMPSGYLAAFMSVGGALATALTGFLLQFVDWQLLLFVFGLPGVVCAIWFFWWFRDEPSEHPGVNDAELAVIRESGGGESFDAARANPQARRLACGLDGPSWDAPSWVQLLLAPEMLLLCLQQFCRAAAYIFYATWWPTFLQESRGLTEEESGYFGSLPLLGVVVGSALGGQIMDWIYRRTGSVGWSRRGTAVICLLTSGGLMIVGYASGDVWMTVIALTASCIFAGACGPAAYTFSIDHGGKHVATVFSVMNMSGNIGAALMPTAIVPVRAEYGWDSILWMVGVLYFVAAMSWLCMRMPERQ